MSVMLLTHNHISALVNAAVSGDGLHMGFNSETIRAELATRGIEVGLGGYLKGRETAQALGDIMAETMAYSFYGRYDLPADDIASLDKYISTYTYPISKAFDYTPTEVSHALSSFEYQACEAPNWEESAAFNFCQLLAQKLLKDLVARDCDRRATWSIPAT